MEETPTTTQATNPRHLVVTVHGIRTFGQWQDRLASLLEENEPGVLVLNYRYGYFSVLAFMLPLLRALFVRQFRNELREILKTYRGARVDLVGHSFGTHLIGYALRGLHREGLDFRVHTVLLAGSVLKVNFPWRSLMDGGRVHRLVNDCGTRDDILVLSQAAVLGTGMAGRAGFNGLTHARFRNRYFAFGHGGFFTGSDGTPDDAFMSEWWLPLLTSDAPPSPHDVREATAVIGFWTFVLNNAEPIKVAVYTSIPAALGIWFFSLWLGEKEARRTGEIQTEFAKTQAKAAEKARAIAKANEVKALHNLSASLAARSAAVRDNFPQRSVLLAAESVNTYIKN